MSVGNQAAPLGGVRGVDFSRTLAGALSSNILSDLGADMIMVEVPSRGPRGIAKSGLPGTTTGGVDARGNYECRGKRSVVLNLHEPRGLEIFREMAKHLDIVQNNWRPGTAERMGVDFQTLSKINPRIICCSISGYGSKGPYRDRGSFDSVAAAHTGILSMSGEPDGPPMLAGQPFVDYSTAVWASHGILAALYHREHTGVGQHVEVSLFEVGLSTHAFFATQHLLSGKIPRAPGWSVGMFSLAGIFPTQDGHVTLGVLGDRSFPPFCRALDRPEWAEDPRFVTEAERMKHKRLLLAQVHEVMAQKPTEYWVERLLEARVPVAPVNNLDAALSDPHTQALGCVITVDGAEGKPVPMVRGPVNLSNHQPTYEPVPRTGQHTAEVLQGLLGYSQHETQQLQEEGIVSLGEDGDGP